MRKSRFTSLFQLVILALLTCFVGFAVNAEDEEKGEEEKGEQINFLFGNLECPVMGERVDDEVFIEYQDEENDVYGRVYLCCPGCEKKAKANLEKLYGTLYEKDKKTGEDKDPLDLQNEECPISGKEIEDGKSIKFNGMIVHLCCPGCVQPFLECPDKNLVDLVPDAEEYEYDRSVGSGTSKEDHEHHHEDK